MLALTEVCPHLAQVWGDSQCKIGGHEGVALLAPSACCMRCPVPSSAVRTNRDAPIKEANKRQDGAPATWFGGKVSNDFHPT